MNDNNNIFAFGRFFISISALVGLALTDLRHAEETIPSFIYIIIGAMNGVDLYNLVKTTKNGS